MLGIKTGLQSSAGRRAQGQASTRHHNPICGRVETSSRRGASTPAARTPSSYPRPSDPYLPAGAAAASPPARTSPAPRAGDTIAVDVRVGEEACRWRPCSARSACKCSHRTRSCCSRSDSDELGISAWRERVDAMLRSMRAVRRRLAAVRGLIDAGDDVQPEAL
jgi:hypothetical protein